MPQRLIITWDDINSPAVEEKLRQQTALTQAAQHYETADVPSAPRRKSRWNLLWYNTIFYTGIFGAAGGLLGWIFGSILHLRPDAQIDARGLGSTYQEIQRETEMGLWTPEQASQAMAELKREGKDNPYFSIFIDSSLSPEAREIRRQEIARRDEWKNFLANLLFYGMSGMMIAAALGMADPVIERNWPAAVSNASVGAIAGLVGGITVSLFVEQLYLAIVGGVGSNASTMRQILARVIEWGILGLFLSAGPGLLMRSARKLAVGLLGGLAGGVAGGLLFVPVEMLANSDFFSRFISNGESISRLVGLVAIGAVAGVSTGFIENAVKSGWFKVTEGIIAGKQFVLYRNPTYIGSSPLCHIYLFKDPQVGRRHAAVHIIGGAFELEDLPLGAKTFVNGKPVQRARLRNGDRVRIGATGFHFQEKARA
jgi:hypothetical protein